MNPYLMLGSGLGTNEATALSARLSTWHDAMVAHERRLRTSRTRVCDDECPHAEAPALWSEAVATFGSRRPRADVSATRSACEPRRLAAHECGGRDRPWRCDRDASTGTRWRRSADS